MQSIVNGVSYIGDYTRNIISFVGMAFIFLLNIFKSLFSRVPPVREIIRQIQFIGVKSLPVLLVSSLFTGMAVALNLYNALIRFGSADLLGPSVAVGLIRELGPVMTALMIIARVSSATCAEIGIMRNEQQFDALDCMAINSYRYVMLPRLVAALISLPILTAVFDIIGIVGGYVVGVVIHGESGGTYIQGIFDTVTFNDVLIGQIKSVVFAIIIIWIPMAYGYFLHLNRKAAGAAGVSHATTKAVVLSAIFMLVTNFIVSSLML
jgi:phospholipid/cholesterol/gamma-HCH transport system permease protein